MQKNGPFSILVVEDIELNKIIAIKMLEKMGYRTYSVSNGIEAIAALEAQHFDLVLMDCLMPLMDGYTATESIRKRSSRMFPIIAMTANASRGDRERCLAVGMNDYLRKPFQALQLDEVLQRWLIRGL